MAGAGHEALMAKAVKPLGGGLETASRRVTIAGEASVFFCSEATEVATNSAEARQSRPVGWGRGAFVGPTIKTAIPKRATAGESRRRRTAGPRTLLPRREASTISSSS